MTATQTSATQTRWPRPAELPPADARLVVVEASAGTGKTFFLEHRVADLVVAGATLDQILVVTFTEKATRELRGRIRDLLDRMTRPAASPVDGAHWTIGDAERCRLADAALAFDRAPIYTIHAFCQRVLIEDAFAGRRLFDQTQIPDEAAFDDAFVAVLRERFARDPADVSALRGWLRKHTVPQLRDMLLACLRADAPIAPAFAPGALCDATDTLRIAIAAAGAPASWLPKLGVVAQTAKAIRDRVDKLSDLVPGLPTDPFGLVAALDEHREHFGYLVDKAVSPLRKTGEPALRALGDAIAAVFDAVVPLDAAVAARFLPAVVERMHDDKRERGQFDYQDMLRLVHAVLVDPERGPALAARLRRRHPWALIDEFQDTDPVQWDIFRIVWGDTPGGHPGGMVIVGDPKQAIYGFRGADVATYLRARDELIARGALQVALDTNRRSTPALVDAVNALVIRSPLQVPFFTGGIACDHPARAAGDVVAPEAGPPIRVIELLETGDAARDLVDKIGDEIEQLLAAPPQWRCGDADRVVGPGDIMVLCRSNAEVATVASALRGRGVPCTLVQAESLFEQPEASDLAYLLDAIAAPRDRSRRLRAWTTAFFGVPWSDLAALAGASDDHPLVEPLFAWSALAQRRDYERLFARILDDTRFAERALIGPGGERAVTNTNQVIELLVREVARARGEIHELVRRLRRWIGDGGDRPDDFDMQRLETDADAVQVMTVHRAKGLEAAVVFVYGGTGTPSRGAVATFHDGGVRSAAVGSKLDAALKYKIETGELAEHQRLAYVALTRARIRMYLPFYGKVTDRAMYRPIQDAIGLVRRGDPPGFVFESLVPAPPPTPAPDDALIDLDVPAAIAAEPPRPIAGDRAGRAIVSYSRLARAAKAADAFDPRELDIVDDDDPSVPLGPDELPGGIATGLFVHAVLERVDVAAAASESDPDAWGEHDDVAPIFRDAARRHGIDERFLPHARRIVHATLTRPLDIGDEILPPLHEARARARELEFAYPLPGAPGRGFVKGVIDLLVEWDDRLWIADYKTDLLANPTRAAARVRVKQKYELQAHLYGLAAARLGRPIGGLLYWFVRDQIVVALPCGGDEIARWTAWLAGLELAR